MALLVTGAALLLAAPAEADEVTVKPRKAAKSTVADYWTADRIAAARPLRIVRARDGEARLDRDSKDPFNHPAEFTSGAVADPALAPQSVNGKVYGKIKGVGPYECSATSVDAANHRTIFTAGHCVADPSRRKLASKLVFVPSYEDGLRPFGTWVFERIFVLKSWRKNSNFNFDFAAVRMSPQGGVDVQDAVGGAPFAFNLPVDMEFTSVGYPSNIDGGQRMWSCSGEFAGRDPRPIPKGPRPIAMGCDMGAGASGGGWFHNGHLNSVTSFGYKDHPDVGYGPYFGRKAADLYEKAAR